MKTTWKYQPLFAFNVVHPVLQNTSFTLEPSRSCYAQLQQAGFIYKHIENGNTVITEKLLLPDGSKKVINRITKPIVLSFLLRCNDLELFKQTTDALQGNLPSFSGRGRVFYFDNMDAGGILDNELEYPAQTTLVDYDFAVMSLSSNERVSTYDLSSIFPNRLKISMEGLAQLRLAKISPGNSSINNYTQ